MDEKILSKIQNNQQIADELLKEALSTTDENDKLKKISELVKFLTFNTSNCMSSSAIENELLKIGQNHEIELSKDFKANSYLHVLSVPYRTGGHTRVVERWIKNSPKTQQHSVILTDVRRIECVPQLLIKNIEEKNGEIFMLNQDGSFIEKALELRQIASGYDKVILHTHMYDIIPVLAFASENFERPVVFFNHADHLFWVGVSISDLVVDFRTFSLDFDKKYRKTTRNTILPLPVNKVNYKKMMHPKIKATELKKQLGFEENSKIILTLASGYKYNPFGEYDFVKTIHRILAQNPDAVLLAIGPKPDNPYWAKAQEDSNGRIKAIGEIPNTELEKYLSIADLAIDSFPFSSFIALLDIAKYNIPSLSLATPVNDLDCFTQAGIYCKSQEKLIKKALEILKHETQEETELYKILKENNFSKGFRKHLRKLYKDFPKEHRPAFFESDSNKEITELEKFVCQVNLTM